VRCDLVLLIDQFEELFAASVSEAERTEFIELVAALVGTGRIWVVATLRAEFYARMLDQLALKELKELGATYDLASPGPVELAEIVRAPAEAAGLVFETDAASGESLDARLLHDADRPDMLPLVQLALSRLFEGRESVDGEIRLPLKVYESLGGLKGIINEAGETALVALGEAEKARLPRLLRQLAVPAHDQGGTGKGALTIRAAPLAEAAPDAATRKLLEALVTARLLTTSGIEADAQVRLAHQRVLEDWSRARAIVAESADFYRIRADLEESRRKWEAGRRRTELLLARGLPLAEAQSIVGKYGDELAPEVRVYVRASRTRANRSQIVAWGAAVAFALVAVGAGIAAKVALDQQTRADNAAKVALDQRAAAEAARTRTEQALAAATEIANTLVFDIGQDPRIGTLPRDLLSRIFDSAIRGYDQVIKLNSNYGAAYDGRGNAYRYKGEFDHAIANFDQAITLDPKDAEAYSNRGVVYYYRDGFDHALADFNQAIALDPKNALAFYRRGAAFHEKGDLDQAIADYSQAIKLNPNYVVDESAYRERGSAYQDKGGLDQAIADYSQAITLDPNSAAALYRRGKAKQLKGDKRGGDADIAAAKKIDPNIGN